MIKTQPKIKRFVCKFCQTDVKPKSDTCDRCKKNLNDYGQPKKCSFCKLNSAFIGSKCQRCSSSQKKYGAPTTCSKCGVQSAFDHEKAKINDQVLCWLCYVTLQRKIRHGKRKMERKENSNEKVSRYSPTKPLISDEPGSDDGGKEPSEKESLAAQSKKPSTDLRRKAHANNQKHQGRTMTSSRREHSLDSRLATMKKNFTAAATPSAPTAAQVKQESGGHTPKLDSEVTSGNSASAPPAAPTSAGHTWNGSTSSTGLPSINDGNIVLVAKLREQVESLKKQLSKKDQQLLDKDKQLCLVKVRHLNEVKDIRTKYQAKEDEYLKSLESYRNKNQALLKKIAQISKGKA